MHKLTNWTVKRSGANVVVSGINERGESEKHQCGSVTGPDASRLTVAWKLNGNPIVLETRVV